jgi:TPP-dependent pyruvate/acetoin dehydrogenase alpha subunit
MTTIDHTRESAADQRLVGAPGEPRDARLYRRVCFIRRFEETLLNLFEEGFLTGTTHACIGQEANSVGLMEHLREGDHLFSNHRCHGHFLAWSGDAFSLLAEIMGKPAGLCAGIGGSQHICAPGFKSNGVQGGIAPAAAGNRAVTEAQRIGQSQCRLHW